MARTSPVEADTDGDGMDDAFEQRWGLNPLSDADGATDMDDDQFTNLQEYLAGTNVTDDDTDGDGVIDGLDVAPLADIALRVTIHSIRYDSMVEGAIDNPSVNKSYEIYVRVKVAGTTVWTGTLVTMDLELDPEVSVTVDIPDDLWEVNVVLGLWENDTAESSGLNADDHLDVDGTSEDLDCNVVYDLVLGTWKGDTTTTVTDGEDDGLPPDPDHVDGRLVFSFDAIPA